MKVVSLCEWQDLNVGVLRKEGEVFIMSKERYEQVMSYNAGLVKPYVADGEKKPRTRRKAAK